MGRLSDFKQRAEEDKLTVQRKREEAEKKRKNIMKNDPQLRFFREKQYPLFKAILADFAKDEDWFLVKEKPPDNCVGNFRIYYKIREGFWGGLFPKKGGCWRFEFGRVCCDDDGNLVNIIAVYLGVPYAESRIESLRNIPENLTEAKDWFNNFLYDSFKHHR